MRRMLTSHPAAWRGSVGSALDVDRDRGAPWDLSIYDEGYALPYSISRLDWAGRVSPEYMMKI